MNTSVVQSTINAIDKPVIYIDLDYKIRAVNHAYQEVYKKDITLGKSKCFEISHNSTVPCDQNGESCPLKKCQQTGKRNSVVHIHDTSYGQEFCDILMKPIKDEHGITVGFLEILEKINFASTDVHKNKMVGESPEFRHLLKQVNRAAKSDIAVLLEGQTGTGKELVAQALHDASNRKDSPFVIIECTGLSETLFESELFGHEKGAFTGASYAKKGLIEIANGGTVFFDEIGDIPLNMQVKLLRLLETKTYRHVGGLKQKTTNFRFLCASHKNLKELVKKGEFRADLYYRIAGFPIMLPTLSSRKADIPILINYILKSSDFSNTKFSEDALNALMNYAYPGNIRELKNIIEQTCLLADEESIELDDLPEYIFAQDSNNNKSELGNIVTLEDAEKHHLLTILKTEHDSIDEIADKLQVSSRTLYRKLNKYGIKYNRATY